MVGNAMVNEYERRPSARGVVDFAVKRYEAVGGFNALERELFGLTVTEAAGSKYSNLEQRPGELVQHANDKLLFGLRMLDDIFSQYDADRSFDWKSRAASLDRAMLQARIRGEGVSRREYGLFQEHYRTHLRVTKKEGAAPKTLTYTPKRVEQRLAVA